MKVTLDITELLREQKITKAEHDRLLALSKRKEQNHFAHVLKVFGLLAITAGILALAPNAFGNFFTALSRAIGVSALLAIGSALSIAGALKLRSGFLSALSYCFAVALIIVGFEGLASNSNQLAIVLLVASSALAVLALELSQAWQLRYEPVLLIYARVALVGTQLCLAFLSLLSTANAYLFSAVWGIALLALGWWGAKEGRRFVVNLAAVFGSGLFFVRYFEFWGANAPAIIVAGVLAVLFASSLLRYNRRA